MNSKILYGSIFLNKTKKKIKKKIKNYKKIFKRNPFITIINIGKNYSSEIYINKKCIIFKELNIKFKIFYFKKNISNYLIINFINYLNKNKKIDCILIQLPIPKHLNYHKIIETINPYKDVDCLHPQNMGKFLQNKPYIRPCTSRGIIKLLEFYNIKILKLNSVIIGSSDLVGKPMSIELLHKGCTVTVINKKTTNIKKYIKKADLLIIATGKYNFFPIKWIKKKSILIDVGINKFKNNIIGDVNFNIAIKKTKYITPVPGGVGLTTIAMLLKNILYIYKKNNIKNFI